MIYLETKIKEKNFAPSIEEITIDFEYSKVKGEITKLVLEVEDYKNRTIAKLDYPPPFSGNLKWNGALDLEKKAFVTPLQSPYTLKVAIEVKDGSEEKFPQKPDYISDQKSPPSSPKSCGSPKEKTMELIKEEAPLTKTALKNAQIEVLYDSIEIVRAPWATNEETFDEGTREWLCDQLNKLGYYGGPPSLYAKFDLRFYKKALSRFRDNHKDLRNMHPGNILRSGYIKAFKDTNTTQLNFCCLDGKTWKEIPEEKALPKPTDVDINPRIFVEAIGYQADYKEGIDEFTDQYQGNPSTKMEKEKDRLNRPMIPLEAVIYLKNSKNMPELAPEAVGEVRVEWLVNEPPENTSNLPKSAPEYGFTKYYIDDFKIKAGVTNNCPEDYGGIKTPKENWKNPFFLENANYQPYEVKTDSDEEVVWGPTNVDPKFNRCLGRAGLIFWPSFIAGDRYQLKARLSFKGLPNEKELLKVNGKIEFETATFEIWRTAKISAIIGWPPRKSYDEVFEKVSKEYEHAYIHLDHSNIQYLGIEKCLTLEDYKSWLNLILKKCGDSKKELSDYLNHKLDGSGPINQKLLVQENKANFIDLKLILAQPNESKKVLLEFLGKDHSMSQYPGSPGVISPEILAVKEPYGINTSKIRGILIKIKEAFNHFQMFGEKMFLESVDPLYDLIKKKLREYYPDGFIALDYYLGDALIEAINKFADAPSASLGMGDRFLVVDQGVPGKPYFVFAHELGHCFWLRHYEIPMGSKSVSDHDLLDHNCIMSYTNEKSKNYPHHSAEKYTPHFCGMCNLKLRGWDVFSSKEEKPSPKTDIPKKKPQVKAVIYFDEKGTNQFETQQEINSIQRIFSASEIKIESHSLNEIPSIEEWFKKINTYDIYHHIGTGPIWCTHHLKNAHVLNNLLPKYPICFGSDDKIIGAEEDFVKSENLNKSYQGFLNKQPSVFSGSHSKIMEGRFQWPHPEKKYVTINASSISNLKNINTPKILAFLSCPLLGWEPSLAKAFIDKGTQYVIAFRCGYGSNQTAFVRDFYMTWAEKKLKPDSVPEIFRKVALKYPISEPVLFVSNLIWRIFLKSKNEADFESIAMDKNLTFEPHIIKL